MMAGKKIAINREPMARPQPNERARGLINGSDPPSPYAVGNKPETVVRVVIKMGRNLVFAASMIES